VLTAWISGAATSSADTCPFNTARKPFPYRDIYRDAWHAHNRRSGMKPCLTCGNSGAPGEIRTPNLLIRSPDRTVRTVLTGPS
jgi:hypothetical protein